MFYDVIWSSFGVIPRITSENLCKPFYDKLFHSHFGSVNCGKKWKKLQKFEYLENEKSFSIIKNIFYNFCKANIWWKYRNLEKNSEHKL